MSGPPSGATLARLHARNAELAAMRADELPVGMQRATGVRYPRPCPFAGCAVALASAYERDRHVTDHVEGGHSWRTLPPAKRGKPGWEAVPSVLATRSRVAKRGRATGA